MPRKPPDPPQPPINAASSGRPRVRAKRAEQSDQVTAKTRMRREKAAYNKAQDATIAAESQLVKDTDEFMFAPAEKFVEPTCTGDVEEYEGEKADFLLRKAAMRGGENADLRAKWAAGDMTMKQLEAAAERPARDKPGLSTSSAGKGKERAVSASDDEDAHPETASDHNMAADSRLPKTAATKIARFAGLPPSGSTNKPNANESNVGSSQRKRANPYTEEPFADSPQVPQVTRKETPSIRRPTTPALSRKDNSTILDGRRLHYPQSLPPDEPIHVPATAATVPDTPPRKKNRHVSVSIVIPTATKSTATKPTTKSATTPRRPSGNLKISSSAPTPSDPAPKTRQNNTVPRSRPASPAPQRARVSHASNPKPSQVALASTQKSNAASATIKRAAPSHREPGRVATPTAAGQQAMPSRGHRLADRSPRPSSSNRPARQDVGTNQGAVIAKASSHSRAGHTSINKAQLSVTANGHPVQPVRQDARRPGPDASGSARRVPQPAANHEGAGNQPARPRVQAGNRNGPLPREPNHQQPNRQERDRREPAPQRGREARNDDIDDDDPLDDVEGEEDLALIPEEDDPPDPTNADGSPTDPGEAILFNYKAVLRSFAPQSHPTVRTFRTRYKVKKIAQGSYEWAANQAGERYPSDETMGARVWKWATRKNYNDYPYLIEHVKHGNASVCSYRTGLRNSIEPTVMRICGFSNDDPEKNRRLAKELLPHAFHELETELGIEPFGNGFIEEACLDAIFNGPSSFGVKYPMYFSPISWRFLALVAALANNVIRGWREGVYKREALDMDKQLPFFRKYLAKVLEAHAKHPVRLENLCRSIPDVGRARYEQPLPPSPSPEPEARWAPDVQERYVPRFPVQAANEEDDDVEMEDAEELNPVPRRHAGPKPAGRRQTSLARAASGKGKARLIEPSTDDEEIAPGPANLPVARRQATRSGSAGPSQQPRSHTHAVAPEDGDDEELPSPSRIRMEWDGPAPKPKAVRDIHDDNRADGDAPGYDDGADDDDQAPWHGSEGGDPALLMAPEDPEEAEYEDEAEQAYLD